MIRIISTKRTKWWRPNSNGYTDLISEAATWETLTDLANDPGPGWAFLNGDVAAVVPVRNGYFNILISTEFPPKYIDEIRKYVSDSGLKIWGQRVES